MRVHGESRQKLLNVVSCTVLTAEKSQTCLLSSESLNGLGYGRGSGCQTQSRTDYNPIPDDHCGFAQVGRRNPTQSPTQATYFRCNPTQSVIPPNPGAIPSNPGAVQPNPGAIPPNPGAIPPHLIRYYLATGQRLCALYSTRFSSKGVSNLSTPSRWSATPRLGETAEGASGTRPGRVRRHFSLCAADAWLCAPGCSTCLDSRLRSASTPTRRAAAMTTHAANHASACGAAGSTVS
eukprot:gene15372-biopygen6667